MRKKYKIQVQKYIELNLNRASDHISLSGRPRNVIINKYKYAYTHKYVYTNTNTHTQIHKYKYKNTFSPRHLIIYHSLAAPQLRNVITERRAGNFFGGGRFAKENFFSGIFAQETSSAGDLQKKWRTN